MNQILSTSNSERNKKGGPIEINTIVKFFSIILIIFGVIMISTASYAIYKKSVDKNNISTKPSITEEQKDDKTVLLKVTHDKAIDKIEYSWNEQESKIITGNGRKYIEQEIEIPGGTNKLHVSVTDIEGQEISNEQTYETEDIIKMEINNGKVKVSAEAETEISYMTYRWDEEQEEKIDINATTVEQEIEIPMGEHTLTVILVDKNNETITKEQKVKGVVKPKIQVKLDEAQENFLITVTDDSGLDRIEFIINGENKTLTANEGQKEMKLKLPLKDGENRVEIIAYNLDGIESDKTRANKTK